MLSDADEHFLLGTFIATADEIPTVALATASFHAMISHSRADVGFAGNLGIWGFIKILRSIEMRRPPLVLIENVPGFLTSTAGRDFEDTMLALNDLSYAVDPFILDAAWFVPQI